MTTTSEHIEIINAELGAVKADISAIKEKCEWLTKFQWLILSTCILALVANIIA